MDSEAIRKLEPRERNKDCNKSRLALQCNNFYILDYLH